MLYLCCHVVSLSLFSLLLLTLRTLSCRRNLDNSHVIQQSSTMPNIVTNDGIELTYHDSGDNGGPTVVLVHGWSGSSQYFTLNASEAAGKGLRVVSYDQRFHGDSAKPDYGLHVARLAADLSALLTKLDLNDVTVVGTSMGCSVIWSYIELFGEERLQKAVFVDQAPLQNLAPDWKHGSKGCYDNASLTNLQAALHADMQAFAKGNGDCCATLPIDAEVDKTLVQETLKCRPEHLAQLMADHTQLDWRPVLKRVTIPCLNMIGCHSGVFPIEGCEAVSKLISGCETVYFKNANHWLYLEEPEAFNQLLIAFASGKGIESVVHDHSSRVSIVRP